MKCQEKRGRMKVGTGKFTYEVEEGWGKLPEGWSFVEVGGVAVDSGDRVYVFNRSEHPVIVFDREGNFIKSWGEDLFRNAHAALIGPDDALYCTDDRGHTVRKTTLDGEVLLTLGTPDQPSDTGYDGGDYRTIKRDGPPFNRPTNLALSPAGEIYITDGYGNCRVHVFSSDGKLLRSWGDPGTGPGQFNLPHGIAVSQKGIVYVADRQNNRIQLFTPGGKYLSEWGNLNRPTDVRLERDGNLYVSELGHQVGISQGMPAPTADSPRSRVSIFDLDGKLLARFEGDPGTAPGNFCAAHTVCTDSRGDMYVGEVSARRGKLPADVHVLQKFIRMA
jgi:DNA-binding beta-propeller fold protein YncE